MNNMQSNLLLFAFASINIILAFPIPVYSQLNPSIMDEHRPYEVHMHISVEMSKDGKNIIIPSEIGIDPLLWNNYILDRYSALPGVVSPIHTHDYSGTFHIESTIFTRFTLGNLLDIWGIDQSKIKKVTVDGISLNSTNYRSVPLEDGINKISIEIKPDNPNVVRKQFSSNVTGLNFLYPSNWSLNVSLPNMQQVDGKASFVQSVKLTPDESKFLNYPPLSPYIFIEKFKLPFKNMTLDAFIVESFDRILNTENIQSPNTLDFVKSINSSLISFDNIPAREIMVITDSISQGNTNITKQKNQIWVVTENNGYIFSYEGVLSENFTSYPFNYFITIAEEVINSVGLH